jgi:hypothetical protein
MMYEHGTHDEFECPGHPHCTWNADHYVNPVGQAAAKFAHTLALKLGRVLGRIANRKER